MTMTAHNHPPPDVLDAALDFVSAALEREERKLPDAGWHVLMALKAFSTVALDVLPRDADGPVGEALARLRELLSVPMHQQDHNALDDARQALHAALVRQRAIALADASVSRGGQARWDAMIDRLNSRSA